MLKTLFNKVTAAVLAIMLACGCIQVYSEEYSDAVIKYDFEDLDSKNLPETYWKYLKGVSNDTYEIEKDEKGSVALKIIHPKTQDTDNGAKFEFDLLRYIKDNGKSLDKGMYEISFDVRFANHSVSMSNMGLMYTNPYIPSGRGLATKGTGIRTCGNDYWINLTNFRDRYLTVVQKVDFDTGTYRSAVYDGTVQLFESETTDFVNKNFTSVDKLVFGFINDTVCGTAAGDGIYYIDNISIKRMPLEITEVYPPPGELAVNTKEIIFKTNIRMKTDTVMSENIDIYCDDIKTDKEKYSVEYTDSGQGGEILLKTEGLFEFNKSYRIVITDKVKATNGLYCKGGYEVIYNTGNLIDKCDFDNGKITDNWVFNFYDGAAYDIERDPYSDSLALKLSQEDISEYNASSAIYYFKNYKTGKICASFDVRFANNSKYFSSIGCLQPTVAEYSYIKLSQKEDAIYYNDSHRFAMKDVLKESCGYFTVQQTVNMDTGETEYSILQNGNVIDRMYDYKNNENFTDVGRLAFMVGDASSVWNINGSGDGTGEYYIDNISVSYVPSEITYSNTEENAVYGNTVFAYFDRKIDSDTLNENSVQLYCGNQKLDSTEYKIETGPAEQQCVGYTAERWAIKISINKNYYKKNLRLVLNKSIKDIYGFSISKKYETEFQMGGDIGKKNFKIVDEQNEQIYLISDAIGKKVHSESTEINPFNLNSINILTLKDAGGRLRDISFTATDSDGITVPENAENNWYFENYTLESADCIKPLADKQTALKCINVFVDASAASGGDGSLESPFNCIEDVQNYLYGSTFDLPVTVYFRSGIYNVSSTINISDEYSSPVTYASYFGENAVFDGSKVLSNYRSISDESVINRLSPEASLHVVEYDLREHGISYIDDLQTISGDAEYEKGPVRVYYNDNPMTLSKYPNYGFLTSDSVSYDEENQGTVISYSDEKIKHWLVNDVYIFSYPKYDWAPLFTKANRRADNTVFVSDNKASEFAENRPFYFVDILEELDGPGEYYIDRDKLKLYLYPVGNIEEADVRIDWLDNNMINIKDASNIVFKDIMFKYSRSNLADIKNSNNIRFVNCTLANSGGIAVKMNNTKNCEVYNCEIYNTGSKGIELDSGNQEDMIYMNNHIRNNYIHDFALVEKTYRPGISVNGVGNIVSNNEICNSDHMAISFGGNFNIIEYNDIHNVLRYASDSGAIYSGRTWINGGNSIRYNYFHDLGKTKSPYWGVYAVYLDDGMYGTNVYGNIFDGIEEGIFSNGGRCNDIFNNIFVDTGTSVKIQKLNSSENINPVLYSAAKRMLAYISFRNAFPDLESIITEDRKNPVYNKIYNNVLVNSGDITLDKYAEETGEVQNNYSTNDYSVLTDYSEGIYTINENSDVFKNMKGFVNPNFENIGRKLK